MAVLYYIKSGWLERFYIPFETKQVILECCLANIITRTEKMLRLSGFCPGQHGWVGTRINIPPTHTYSGHQSSLICFLDLLQSTASSLFNLRARQSFSAISLSKFSLVNLYATCTTSHTTGEPVPEGTFRHLLAFLEQNEDNTGRRTNNPDGLPPHPD